jgi:hypothetical protein
MVLIRVYRIWEGIQGSLLLSEENGCIYRKGRLIILFFLLNNVRLIQVCPKADEF